MKVIKDGFEIARQFFFESAIEEAGIAGIDIDIDRGATDSRTAAGYGGVGGGFGAVAAASFFLIALEVLFLEVLQLLLFGQLCFVEGDQIAVVGRAGFGEVGFDLGQGLALGQFEFQLIGGVGIALLAR